MNERLLFIFSILLIQAISRPTEQERVALWREKNVWPPNWQEESESYRVNKIEREKEIMQLPGADERWENWMQFTQGQMVPKFTQQGFDLIDTPPEIHAKLLTAVKAAIDDVDTIPYEEDTQAIYGDLPPKFLDIHSLAWEVIEELKELHEQWAGGIKLKATSAYGVRFYQNGSSLVMHHDKVETHVISSIIHIAHEYDNDAVQWPIQIEDHDSNMHSVNLKPGQMLFYESAKCLHGRMQPLKGKYYGSLFVHYQPVDESIWLFDNEDVIANVPPHWNEGLIEDEGSRWAGQGLTIDSLAPFGIGPRVVQGEFVHDNVSPYAYPADSLHSEL